MNVRRMEAETIRDAMLALSGQISLRLGGKPVPVMEDEVGQFVIGKENLDGERKPGKAVDLQARNIAAASTCRCAARASYPSSMPSTHPPWSPTAPSAPFPPWHRKR